MRRYLEPNLMLGDISHSGQIGKFSTTCLHFAGAQTDWPTYFFSHSCGREAWLNTILSEPILEKQCNETVVRTWANSAWRTAAWWGVVRVRVRFFFTDALSDGGGPTPFPFASPWSSSLSAVCESEDGLIGFCSCPCRSAGDALPMGFANAIVELPSWGSTEKCNLMLDWCQGGSNAGEMEVLGVWGFCCDSSVENLEVESVTL